MLLLGLRMEAHAAHPLLTEDTGTQGKGGRQVEVNAEWTRDDFGGVRVKGFQPAATLSYGFAERADVQYTIPYLRQRPGDKGVLDAALDVKWRFFENGPLSLGLKPGLTLPTGDDASGFGSGRVNWGSLLILSYDLERWAFHSHAGYRRNRNTQGMRESLSHLSAAVWFKASDALRLVVDLSMDTDPDPASNRTIRQTVFGLIYSLSKDFDLDAGVRRGNKPAIDRALLCGLTYRW
ncbi:MAG TPA: transporter [Burkholderiales bacterium]|nr:transporter [Burkholderiales bacterium]